MQRGWREKGREKGGENGDGEREREKNFSLSSSSSFYRQLSPHENPKSGWHKRTKMYGFSSGAHKSKSKVSAGIYSL